MKLIVQTKPPRDITHLKTAFPDLIVIEDTGGGPLPTFVESIRAACNERHIHLEDDIEVSSQFPDLSCKAIDRWPDQWITFFNVKKSFTETTELPGRAFCMNQCFYVPPGHGPALVEFSKGWTHPTNANDPDMLVRDFLVANRLKFILHLPCLVQHKNLTSEIDPRRARNRQSKQFIHETTSAKRAGQTAITYRMAGRPASLEVCQDNG